MKPSTPISVILASGGTGGHLFPALSVAEEMKKRGHTVSIVTDNRGLVFFRNNDHVPIFSCTIQRKHWLFGKLLYPFSLCWQILRCVLFLIRHKPQAVLGFGGYPSFPCVCAAQLLGIPTFIHEGNAFLGKANRLLKRRARRIALSFPPSSTDIIDPRICVTGMPVRAPIAELAKEIYHPAEDTEIFNLLILGGSQGAKIFGSLIPRAISLLPKELQKRILVTQQCREQQLNEVQQEYDKLLCKRVIKPFLSPIEWYYREAHLVISRSGASTIAELALAGKPALLVPFQHSIEGDQLMNAHQLVESDAAWMMREHSLSVAKLADFLKNVLLYKSELAMKARAIRKFSCPEAAANVVDMLENNL